LQPERRVRSKRWPLRARRTDWVGPQASAKCPAKCSARYQAWRQTRYPSKGLTLGLAQGLPRALGLPPEWLPGSTVLRSRLQLRRAPQVLLQAQGLAPVDGLLVPLRMGPPALEALPEQEQEQEQEQEPRQLLQGVAAAARAVTPAHGPA
jgi:hypothetical protein